MSPCRDATTIDHTGSDCLFVLFIQLWPDCLWKFVGVRLAERKHAIILVPHLDRAIGPSTIYQMSVFNAVHYWTQRFQGDRGCKDLLVFYIQFLELRPQRRVIDQIRVGFAERPHLLILQLDSTVGVTAPDQTMLIRLLLCWAEVLQGRRCFFSSCD